MNCPHCNAPNADEARFCGTCGRATSATEPASNPNLGEAPAMIGREIAGRYRILAKLGEGGMGTVYRAEQMSLKRVVAVKLLRPEVAASPTLLRRFNAEAEVVAKLSHPNTVNIYDFGQDADGTLFIAMEFIEGSSLRTVMHREAPLPLRRALAIVEQIAASLIDAHAQGIIHRDLKPDNVMLQERGKQRDVARVLDFGIAKLRDENRQSQLAMTQAGDMLGTPQYMAPEQIRGEPIDGRTDVYALGCMLYEMITARLPYEAQTVMSLLSKHLLDPTIPPSQRRPDLMLPPQIDQLILGAMAKDPKVRPPTMEQFADQVSALLATLPADTAAHPAQPRPATAAQPVPTPPAFSAYAPAGFAPPGPPPQGPPPQGPPGMPATSPQAFVPGVPPPAPPGNGYAPGGAPPGAPAYDPHVAPTEPPYAHPPALPGPRAPQGSPGGNKTIWIVLAALVLVGGGVGLYVANKGSGSKDPAPLGGGTLGGGGGTLGGGGGTLGGGGGAVDPWGGGGGSVDDDDEDDVVVPNAGNLWPPSCAELERIFESAAGCSTASADGIAQGRMVIKQLRDGLTAYEGADAATLQSVYQAMEIGCAQGVVQARQAMAAQGCK